MSLKDIMAADVVAIFLNTEEHAEKILYNGKEITAICTIGETNQHGNTFTTQGQTDRAQFSVAEADVSAPCSGDVIEYRGVTWNFARVVSSGGGMFDLEFTAGESVL